MSTLNISVTNDQAKLVDDMIFYYHYANRSEFFRSMLRLIEQNRDLVRKTDEFLFEPPKIKNTDEIVKKMEDSGNYSKKFIKSVARGMRESGYYATNTTNAGQIH